MQCRCRVTKIVVEEERTKITLEQSGAGDCYPAHRHVVIVPLNPEPITVGQEFLVTIEPV